MIDKEEYIKTCIEEEKDCCEYHYSRYGLKCAKKNLKKLRKLTDEDVNEITKQVEIYLDLQSNIQDLVNKTIHWYLYHYIDGITPDSPRWGEELKVAKKETETKKEMEKRKNNLDARFQFDAWMKVINKQFDIEKEESGE